MELIQYAPGALRPAAYVRERLGNAAATWDAGNQAISQLAGKCLRSGTKAANVDGYGSAQIVIALALSLESDCMRVAVFGVLDFLAAEQSPNQSNVLGKRFYPHRRAPERPHRRISRTDAEKHASRCELIYRGDAVCHIWRTAQARYRNASTNAHAVSALRYQCERRPGIG